MVKRSSLFLISAFMVAIVILAGCQPVKKAPDNKTKVWFPENISIDKSKETKEDNMKKPAETEMEKPSETSLQVVTIVVNESQLVKLTPNTVSPEGLPIKYTYTLPLNANGTWQTKEGDAGEYLVTITATDGITTDTLKVLLVVRSLNRAPVLGKINDVTVREGDTISFDPIAVDPDGDSITITYSGFMQSNTYKTKFGDSGEYFVTVTASDGRFTDTRRVKVTILKTNRPPMLRSILDVTVTEGDKIIVRPQAFDPDGDIVTFTFGSPLDASGTWQTRIGDVGTYKVNITASDGKLTDTKSIFIIVSRKNLAPVLAPINPKSVKEGQTLTFSVEAIDPDNDLLTYSIFGLPEGATFNSRTRVFNWTPNYDAVSVDDKTTEFRVTFLASDGQLTDSESTSITVENVPRPIQIVDVKQG